MRDMAKIVTVDSVIPMWQKDRICAVTFKENAYEVIVPKEDAVVGKHLVFIEADSILPVKPEWEFLRKRCFKPSLNGFLIRPMTMGRKDANGLEGERVLSWGLAVTPESIGLENEKVGADVTEKLGIVKYEPAEDASPNGGGNRHPAFIRFLLRRRNEHLRNLAKMWIGIYGNKGGFPTNVISKSDETTIQNCKDVLETFKDDVVYTTAKMEGQSVTALLEVKKVLWFKHIRFYVCSRNTAYKNENDNAFWAFAKRNDLARKFTAFYNRTGLIPVIQAEQCGPGIQSNIYNFDSTRWFVYEAKTINPATGVCRQLTLDEMIALAIEFGLDHVPVLDRDVKLKDIMPDVDAAVKYAERAFYMIYKDDEGRVENFAYGWNDTILPEMKLWSDYMMHEGVVVRSMNCDKDRGIGCSFKVKNMPYAELDLPKMAKAVRMNLN